MEQFSTPGLSLSLKGKAPSIIRSGHNYSWTEVQKRRKEAKINFLSGNQENPSEFKLANLGVSVSLIFKLQNKSYLLVVEQEREGISILKLPSGYINLFEHQDPYLSLAKIIEDQTLRELSEEVLIFTLGGKLSNFQIANSNRVLRPDFADLFTSSGVSINLDRCEIPGAISSIHASKKIVVDNQIIDARIYQHTPTASAQIIFGFSANLPTESITISHAEHAISVNGVLESRFFRKGAFLLELDTAGYLTGDIHRMDCGNLIKEDAHRFFLSEAFSDPEFENGNSVGRVKSFVEPFVPGLKAA